MTYSYYASPDLGILLIGGGFLLFSLIGGGFLLFSVVISLIFMSWFYRTKPNYYRRYLSDLYVSAKIREFAKKENVNLFEEEKSFEKYISFGRKDRLRYLDEKIEAELMHKIEGDKIEKEKKI